MSDKENLGAPPREDVRKGLIYLVNMTVANLVTPVADLRGALRLAVDQGLTARDPELATSINGGLSRLGSRLKDVDEAVRKLAEACVLAHEAAKEVHGGLPSVFASVLDEGFKAAKRAIALGAAVGAEAARLATKGTPAAPSGIIVAS